MIKSHGRRPTLPPLATPANFVYGHRLLWTPVALDHKQYPQYSPDSFDKLSLIVKERHTRFPQFKQATEGSEQTLQKPPTEADDAKPRSGKTA